MRQLENGNIASVNKLLTNPLLHSKESRNKVKQVQTKPLNPLSILGFGIKPNQAEK